MLLATSRRRDTVLAHSLPEGWADVRKACEPRRFIGQTVWETDPIPRRWHSELAAADEIWVPTRWNADVLRRSGITVPLKVIPHAIESQPAAAPPTLLPVDRFMFLAVGTWEWRKRPDLTLHAYLRGFTDADPVSLVIKTSKTILAWNADSPVENQTWWQVMNIVRQYPNAADVILLTDRWSDAQLAGLIESADCYVSLTAVEGWGLGAFDAAVAGVPLIITGYGGQMEWLGTDHSGLVPFEMEPAVHPDTSMFEPGMTWARADVDAGAQLMRAAVFDSPAFVTEAPALATRLKMQYSETAIGTMMQEALR